MASKGRNSEFEDIVSQLRDDPDFRVGTGRAGAVGSAGRPVAGPRDYALAEPLEPDFDASTYDPRAGSLTDAFNDALDTPSGKSGAAGGWGGRSGASSARPGWLRRLFGSGRTKRSGGQIGGAETGSWHGTGSPGSGSTDPFGPDGRPRGLNDPDNDGAVV